MYTCIIQNHVLSSYVVQERDGVCVCVVACNIYFSLHYVIDLNLLEYMRIQYMMHRLRGIAKALSYYHTPSKLYTR